MIWLALASAVLATVSVGSEASWTTLRGNVQRTGFVAASLHLPFRLLWVRHFIGERMGTSVEPIVAEGKVFVATHNGHLYALDAETGAPLWRFRAHGAFLHSPAYADGLVLAVNSDGCLYAVEAATGKLRWSIWCGQGGFAASPAVAEGLVVIGSRTGKVFGVEVQSGKVEWQQTVGVPVRQTAAIAQGRVFLTPEDLRVRCLNLQTGKAVWVSERLNGQSVRDYYPVIAKVAGKLFVIVRTNPIRRMDEHIGRDRQFLCQQAGIKDGWREIEAWTKSEAAKGNPFLWEREQRAIVQYLTEHPDAQTFFVLDGDTGKVLPPMPVLWASGCQGVGAPPAVLPDGRLLVFYRSAYSNWNLGVAPLVALGILDLTTQRIMPLFHRHGTQPPWNTFWGTADESQHFLLANDTVLIVHQGTLSGFRLSTGELFPIWGDRDSWGGFRNLPWARNEWHGPARSSVAVVTTPNGVRLYWQTGSRLLCLAAGEKGEPANDVATDGTTVPTVTAPPLPKFTQQQLRRQLADTVAELLSRRWCPLFLAPGLAGYEVAFANSGEVFEALAWAFPHLSPELQQQVKAFLVEEWRKHSPFDARSRYPLEQGTPREWWFVPSSLRQRGETNPYHPFGNLYAVWLYAHRCGEMERVRQAWQEIERTFDDFAQSGWRLNPERGDLFANRYLASLLAFHRLAEHFGDEEAAQKAKKHAEAVSQALVIWWQRSAQQASLPVFRNIQEWDAFIGHGDALFFSLRPHRAKIALFHALTPEAAAIVKAQAGEAIRKVWQVFETLCPTWHLVGEERQVHYGENFLDPPDFSESAFRAFAWLCETNHLELAQRLDIPFCRADVSHVLKLALVLDRWGHDR